MAKKSSKNKLEETTKILEKILSHLGFKASTQALEEEGVVKVDIRGDDLGLLIGQHGTNLESLQTIFSVLINKTSDEERLPVVVDINNWRKDKEEHLKQLVEREIRTVKEEGKEVRLPPMPPNQRRIVHLLAGEHEGVASISVGEEPYRSVVLKKA